MKVLLVTGRLAEKQVRSVAGDADVLVADVDVASFITPGMLMAAGPVGYDLVMIPGSITSDFREAERVLSTSVRLGPKNAADIGAVLRKIKAGELALSTTVPACQLIQGRARQVAGRLLSELEARAGAEMVIRGVKIGGRSRMKVLAEVVDATRLSPHALAERIRYYEEEGADMIDLGIPLDAAASDVRSALLTARGATELPISIDTLRADLISAGLEGGADLILSLNAANIPQVAGRVAEAGLPAVVIPGPGEICLEENLKEAQELGVRAIADPVLDPPLLGLAGSIERYLAFSRSHPDVPLFFGVGNATELIDADSTGANAILSAIAAECGASILFSPEYSAKARGSISELAISSRMMMLGRERASPPKELGLDLLILKEKRRLPEEPMPAGSVASGAGHPFVPDLAGGFRIFLSDGMIVARNGGTTVCGTDAADLLNTLIEMGQVSRLDHAGYLGRELERASIALRLKRGYVQDEPLWPSHSFCALCAPKS